MNASFIQEVNMAILDGQPPPKTKRSDQIPRMALALHVLTHSLDTLLQGHQIQHIPTVIEREVLIRAHGFIMHLEQQKDVICQVLLSLMSDWQLGHAMQIRGHHLVFTQGKVGEGYLR